MIRLTDQTFHPGALLDGFCAGRAETGAVVSFTGLARADGGETRALDLQAYPGFTEAEIARIAETARRRFDLDDLMILHRIGAVAPGEPIVFVATAASHRRPAFEGCDYLMDFLKSRAPFWKKRRGPDGDRWVEPRAEDHADIARWEEETSA